MMREVQIGEPGMVPEAARVSLEDVVRYGEIIARVLATLRSIEGMAVGASINLDPIKLRVRGEEFDYDPGIIKRTK